MSKIVAVLGPTNTGKTHLAVERMLGHQSGMIGLPLRLLAREIYDRLVNLRPAHEIALITGEERIVPKQARYFVCTVEAMPADLEVEFLAIDEIQLAGDLDRGHVFTDRLLHRRGSAETMLLGAETMRPLVQKLIPDANFISRPRFSKLSYAGSKKITRLPPRSAIVAFNADAVYAIAELIRRQRGGAAVVMGALSPRTRNAQVEIYQAGDVDFLVATDAIGMGLNMDVNHVAFAATKKFDGIQQRELKPAELAQIAGRAGRHLNDGTFGVTAEAPALNAEIVEQIEGHNFEPERHLQWRNHTRDYSSLQNLVRSINQPPNRPGLVKTRDSDDIRALEAVVKDPETAKFANAVASIKRLWEVCQLPDYRNLSNGEHAELIKQIYGFLMSDMGVIPVDWIARQLAYTDRIDGDIDTLANRISHVRTWTFVANRADWLDDPGDWRDQTRAIEDKLSDALHERLSQRFIDKRTSVLNKRLRQREELVSTMKDDGGIFAEDQFLGNLLGFHFIPDTGSNDAESKALKSASLKIIAQELERRAELFGDEDDGNIVMTPAGAILWREQKIGRLEPGDHILKPRAILIADNQLSGPARERVQKRLEQFVTSKIEADLEPLIRLNNATDIAGLARGLSFRLVEAFGVLVREHIAGDVQLLDQDARKSLRKYGVRFGAYHVFLPALLKPAASQMALILWALQRTAIGQDIGETPALPGQGLTSVPFDSTTPKGFYQAIGFRPCGKRAVRVDMLERLADIIRPRIFWKPESDEAVRPDGSAEGGGFTVIPDMMSLVGCSGEEFTGILRALGYKSQKRKVKPVQPAKQPDTDQLAPTKPGPSDTGAAPAEAVAPPDKSEAAVDAQPEAVQETRPVDTAQSDTNDKTEDKFIEIWLPARKTAARTPSHKPRRQKPSQAKPNTKSRPRKAKTDRPKQFTAKSAAPKSSPFAALETLRTSLNPQDDNQSKSS